MLASTRPGLSPAAGFQARAARASVSLSPARRAGGNLPPSSKTLRRGSSHSLSGQASDVDTAQVEGASEADGEAAAFRFLNAVGNLAQPVVTVPRNADTVTVEVSGQAPRLIPGFDWHVTATAQAPVERFIAEPER